MEHTIKVIGKTVTCMEEECLSGIRQVEDMKVTITLERKKDLGNITTIIPNGMKECGKTVNNTVKVLSIKMVINYSLVDGSMVSKNQWVELVIDLMVVRRLISLDIFYDINKILNQYIFETFKCFHSQEVVPNNSFIKDEQMTKKSATYKLNLNRSSMRTNLLDGKIRVRISKS